MNKWLFRFAAIIVFLDVWILSITGLIYVTKSAGIDIHPVLGLAFEAISVLSFIYLDKYWHDYNEATKIPTTEEVIRKIQYEDMLVDHSSEIINKLQWYADVFKKPLSDFTEHDLSMVDGLKEFAKKELADFADILPKVVRMQGRKCGRDKEGKH